MALNVFPTEIYTKSAASGIWGFFFEQEGTPNMLIFMVRSQASATTVYFGVLVHMCVYAFYS